MPYAAQLAATVVPGVGLAHDVVDEIWREISVRLDLERPAALIVRLVGMKQVIVIPVFRVGAVLPPFPHVAVTYMNPVECRGLYIKIGIGVLQSIAEDELIAREGHDDAGAVFELPYHGRARTVVVDDAAYAHAARLVPAMKVTLIGVQTSQIRCLRRDVCTLGNHYRVRDIVGDQYLVAPKNDILRPVGLIAELRIAFCRIRYPSQAARQRICPVGIVEGLFRVDVLVAIGVGDHRTISVVEAVLVIVLITPEVDVRARKAGEGLVFIIVEAITLALVETYTRQQRPVILVAVRE